MSEPLAVIDLAGQRLDFTDAAGEGHSYPVSTSRFGAGEEEGSYRTPRGLHEIHAKIGADCATGTVFVGRQPTGEVYSEALATAHPDRDWILTRILWLAGLEPGVNQQGSVDTLSRYIYIHGMPDSEPCGTPASIGCIRMRNADIIDFFDRVDVGTRVRIE